MFENLLATWFDIVLEWHYVGVALLMALESTIFPIPSEVIIPPAAYWASQGQMNFWGVIAAGMVGSWMGASLSYFAAQWAGRSLILKFGKYFFLTADKLNFAEQWTLQYANAGVFFARMLPVVRHLIALPAGLFRMNFLKFSMAVLTGSGVWCFILAWFSQQLIGDQPHLLDNPAVLVAVVKHKLLYFAGAILFLGALYFFVERKFKKVKSITS